MPYREMTPRENMLELGLRKAGIGRDGRAELAVACDTALESQPDRSPVDTLIAVFDQHKICATETTNVRSMVGTVLDVLAQARNTGEIQN